MRKKFNLFLIFSLIFTTLLVLPFEVNAASQDSKDGLEISITTDKNEYLKNEDIQISIIIKNNNTHRVDGISLETLLPDGLSLKEGQLNTTDISIEGEQTYRSQLLAIMSDEFADNNNTDDSTTSDDSTSPNVGDNNTDSAKPESTTGSTDTGDSANIILWIALLVVSIITFISFYIIKRKGIKTLSLFLLLFVILSTYSGTEVLAAEDDISSISVEKSITVNNINMVITANVKYKISTDKPLTEAEEYYQNNSEEIISIDDVNENNVLSEKEVYMLMEERGFIQYPITYEYSLDGNYITEEIVAKDSNTKHPMYQTLYITNDGNVWSILVIGKTIVANPAFYNVESDNESQVLISETGTLTSYDDELNLFYTTVPKNSVIEHIQIDKINSETISKMTFEEVE